MCFLLPTADDSLSDILLESPNDRLSERPVDKDGCQVANLDSPTVGGGSDSALRGMEVSLHCRAPCLGLCGPLQGSCQLMLPGPSCSVGTTRHCTCVLVQAYQYLGIITSIECSYESAED